MQQLLQQFREDDYGDHPDQQCGESSSELLLTCCPRANLINRPVAAEYMHALTRSNNVGVGRDSRSDIGAGGDKNMLISTGSVAKVCVAKQ